MNKRIPILIGFLMLVFAVWIQITTTPTVRRIFARVETLAYDLQLRTKIFTHKKFIESPIVIVDIDDKSLSKEGRWPWSRAKLTQLVESLQKDGATVIAFDVLFAEKETNYVNIVLNEIKKQSLSTPEIDAVMQKIQGTLDEDTQFANVLSKSDTVLGITFAPDARNSGSLPPPVISLTTPTEKDLGFINATGYIADIPLFQSAAKNVGFLNVFPDLDGIVRRVPLLIRYQEGLYPSLALQAVCSYLLTQPKLVTASYGDSLRLEGVRVANHMIPTDLKSQVNIPFVGKSFTLPYLSATDVLHDQIEDNSLKGKIVFVGTSATSLSDLHATPIQAVYPGIEIQASIAYGILNDSFSFEPGWATGAEVFITVIFGLICIFTFPYVGPRTLAILILIIPVVLVFLDNWIWENTGLIITIIAPLMLPILIAIENIIYGYLFETRRREHLKEMFGQYVPEKHIDEMLSAGGNYGLSGDDREMTVLFADIRGFTTLSEPLSAVQLKELLNDFFTPMTEIIFKQQGTIDKYVGDMIMAFWGAPLKDTEHVKHALIAALNMQVAAEKLRGEFAARLWPEINIGIGLNTGIMTVGDMGSKFRRNYTVLGDAVNLGSRLEGLTKHYGVKIIVSEYTQQNQPDFLFREVDRVKVKGKAKGVNIFELLCTKQDASKELIDEIRSSEEALNYYYDQNWQQSRDLFTVLHQQHPSVKLYELYLKRIEQFMQNPPMGDWDGIYIHTSK